MKKLICILTLLLALVCVLAACEQARSITKSEIVNGELVLTYSDGTTENLGKVVGDEGAKGDKGDPGEADSENPQGLDFFLLPDGTYAVSAGKAYYLEEVVIPATYRGKAVTCLGLPAGVSDDAAEIGGAGAGFTDAPYLTKVTLPDTITYIGEMAFYDSVNLTEINLPNSLTGIASDAFDGCEKLQYTEYEGGKYLGNEQNPYLYLASVDTSVSSFTFPATTRIIGSDAFRSCSSLTSITLPAGVTSIGSSTFEGCSSLTSVTIPAGVTEIGEYAFSGCNSLTSITLPAGVTEIGHGAFSYCSSLTSVTIPAGVTEIGFGAFSNCSSLTSVTFAEPNGWRANGTPIAASDLADPATAATYLTSTYCWITWTRTAND